MGWASRVPTHVMSMFMLSFIQAVVSIIQEVLHIRKILDINIKVFA